MIQARGLTKCFGTLKALNAVDFTLETGSVYGLVGSNGSGKSTLLRLISGVYHADAGELLIDDAPTFDRPDIKKRIFFLPDTPYFIHQSNLLEMARFYQMMYPSFDQGQFDYLNSIFPISEKGKISTMSKGMQRQAALILALSTMPDYLLLDEAFDGLDPVMRQVLKKLLAVGVSERDMTVLIASHNLRELEDLCDHIALIHQGQILLNEELDSVKGNTHKIQMAFSLVPDLSVFREKLHVLKVERQGSLVRMVVRGDIDEIMAYLNQFTPLFLETVTPTLEEIFIYELEVTGYDISAIIH